MDKNWYRMKSDGEVFDLNLPLNALENRFGSLCVQKARIELDQQVIGNEMQARRIGSVAVQGELEF